mgnify:CR=1 FL=1
MVPASPVSLGEGITEVVGMMMALCIITADICRYGKYRWSGPVAWSAAMMLQVVLLVGASIFTLSTCESDVPGVLLAAGLGLCSFFMVVLGQWSTNQSNIYCSSLAVSMLLPIKRKNIVLILGVFGVGMAGLIASIWGNAMEPFQKFIGLVGTIMPAIAGVVIADFYLMCPYLGKVKVEDRYTSHPGMKLAKVNWLGWLAMGLGTVVGGFVIDFGIPAVNTLMLSLTVYSVLFIACDKLNIPTGLGEHTVTETGE